MEDCTCDLNTSYYCASLDECILLTDTCVDEGECNPSYSGQIWYDMDNTGDGLPESPTLCIG